MTLPDRLEQWIHAGLAAVGQHPEHDLGLGLRQAIWAALGRRRVVLEPKQAAEGPGYKRRAVLALLAASHVLPLWRDVRLPDDMEAGTVRRADPHRLLATAVAVLQGEEDGASAERATSDVFNTLTALPSAGANEIQSFVGLSADRALATVLYDERFDPDHLDLSLTDAARDAWTYDASFFAAGAAADGPVYEPASNALRRRAFWEWWLTQAVPAAWEAVDLKGCLWDNGHARIGL